MNRNEYQRQWNNIYDTYSKNDYMELPWTNNDNLSDFESLIDSLKLGENPNIIDVGCGTGKIASHLSQIGKVYAIDISNNEIERCRNRYENNKNIIFETKNILEIDSSQKYDLVVAHLLLHEIQPEHIDIVCHNIASLVSESGYILLSWLKQDSDYTKPIRPCLYAQEEFYVHYYEKEFIAKKFLSFYIKDWPDIKIKTSDIVLDYARKKNVNGFTYQTLLCRKVSKKLLYDTILDGFSALNNDIKSRVVTSEDKLKNTSKTIFDNLSISISQYLSLNRNIKNANVFLNIQIEDAENGEGLLFTSLYKFINENIESGCESRANILVENYHIYFNEFVNASVKRKFLIHNFFDYTYNNVNAEDIKLLDLYLERRTVYIKREFNNSTNDEPAICLSDFLNGLNKKGHKYNTEKYIEYAELLFNCPSQGNQFDEWLTKRGVPIPTDVPNHYTVWNLSFPYYNYMGTIIVESFSNDMLYPEMPSNCLDEIRNVFHAFKIEFQKAKNELAKARIQAESIKSAISAIMARNMSHNLGSHFISNTKHYFSNLAEIDTNEQRRKDCRGIRHTLQYIQERMDFIATIVSTDRFPYGPVNVKSQIFDELTPDEFGGRHDKATTNFLLDYIVFSEDISKQSNLSSSSIKLSLKLISDNGIKFGGQNKQENQKAKEEFAKLNLAVPGGILGRHAIFTIIENVIRNSAKHDKESIPEDGLTVSIKIDKDYLVIFDNKKNANKEIDGAVLKEELNERYSKIKILSEGAIDKSNKGLKEILISALWLNNHALADWFGEYESISNKDKNKKLSEVLRVVAVDDNGDMTDNGENLGYYIALDRYEEVYYIKDDMVVNDKINYSSISRIKADIIVADKDYEVFIDGNACQNEDVDIDSSDVLKLSNLYPRFYENRDGGELPPVEEMMKAIIERNTGITVKELNDIHIHIEPKNYTLLSNTSNINHCIWHAMGEARGIRKNDILFKNHLSALKTEEMNRVLAAYSDAAYIDSISGGDFTGTITQSFFLQDEFNRLKVIESALTEFVIIDERIFKNYGHGFKKRSVNSEPETNELFLDADKIFNEVEGLLSSGKSCDDIGDNIEKHYHIDLNVSTLMKNDRALIREDIDKKVTEKNREREAEINKRLEHTDNSIASHKMIERRKLHIYDIDKNGNVINLEGINVANVTDLNGIKTLCLPTFLSIHLSIIEKIAKENNIRASEVMENLKMLFGNTKFVTIHSGRGNLSAELEEDLKDYAFLSLSAIQAAMDDSKYFLSQLLYNNCYVGKGRLNHK